MNEYGEYKDVMTRLRDLMVATYGDFMKAYFMGVPSGIYVSMLPCVTIHKMSGNIRNGATGTDSVGEQFVISISMNRLNAQSNDPETDTAFRELYRIVEGRDPATGYYKPNTAVYALRTNMTLGTAVIDNDIDIDYPEAITSEDGVIVEADITIVVREMVAVPNRI